MSTGKRTIYEWTPERRTAVDDAKAARPVDISPWLFCNARGKCYVNEATGEAKSWEKIWQNFTVLLQDLAELSTAEPESLTPKKKLHRPSVRPANT